jgi:hypothetical protein
MGRSMLLPVCQMQSALFCNQHAENAGRVHRLNWLHALRQNGLTLSCKIPDDAYS